MRKIRQKMHFSVPLRPNAVPIVTTNQSPQPYFRTLHQYFQLKKKGDNWPKKQLTINHKVFNKELTVNLETRIHHK